MTVAAKPEPPRTAAGARAFEPVNPRLAFGVDVAAVESLALVLVAENLVGRIDLGELRRRSRVFLVRVGMQLLRQAAERFLDLLRARFLGHPQNLVGVAHPS